MVKGFVDNADSDGRLLLQVHVLKVCSVVLVLAVFMWHLVIWEKKIRPGNRESCHGTWITCAVVSMAFCLFVTLCYCQFGEHSSEVGWAEAGAADMAAGVGSVSWTSQDGVSHRHWHWWRSHIGQSVSAIISSAEWETFCILSVMFQENRKETAFPHCFLCCFTILFIINIHKCLLYFIVYIFF